MSSKIFSMISGGGVTIINGKTYKGNNVTITGDNEVIIDGVKQEGFGDSPIAKFEISIHGNVDKLDASHAKVINVIGDVNNVITHSGNCVISNNVKGNIETHSGDVTVKGNVEGGCETFNGSISANNIDGKVKSKF